MDSKPGPLEPKGSGTRKFKTAQSVGHPPAMMRRPTIQNHSKAGSPAPPAVCRELTGSSQEEIGDSQPIVQFMPPGIDNDGLSDDIEGKRIKIDRVDPAVDN